MRGKKQKKIKEEPQARIYCQRKIKYDRMETSNYMRPYHSSRTIPPHQQDYSLS